MRIFFFEVINAGASEQHLSLGIPWEKDKKDTFSVKIKSK